MADIKAQFLAELDSLETEKRKVAADKADLDVQKGLLYEKQRELDAKKKEATEAVEKAGGLEEINRLRSVLAQSVDEANTRLAEIKVKRLELIKWENRLVEIENRQKADLQKYTQDKADLEEEKRTYKETVRKQFFEEVNKNLPQ